MIQSLNEVVINLVMTDLHDGFMYQQSLVKVCRDLSLI